ncbi:hypothetical protein N9W79_00305 [bacterium]|nr:hypothetical protein [bacterium]
MRKQSFKIRTALYATASLLITVSCGNDFTGGNSEKKNLVVEKDYPFDNFYVDEFGLSTEGGKIKFTEDAVLLGPTHDSLCSFSDGEEISFKAISKTVDSKRRLIFEHPEDTCGLKEGYVSESSVEVYFETSYSLATNGGTFFKISTSQSSTLATRTQKCFISGATKLYMREPAILSDDKVHVKVSLSEEVRGCEFKIGYFYKPHLSHVSLEINQPDNSFAKVIKHILKWEGGCSDHPNDPGGRTFMGITTSRARQNGFQGDVCTMPKSMVLDIYKKDYWNTRPKFFDWPLNLAVMNTEVNSGGGRAAQFIQRMSDRNIDGTNQEKASWFVDQQTDFYYLIADRNPKLRVFLRGWVNRSNYMQDVIAGHISLGDYEFEATASAKLD